MSNATINAEIKGIKFNLSNTAILTALQFAANYQGRFAPLPIGSSLAFVGDSFTDEDGGGATYNRILGVMTVTGPYLKCLLGYNQGNGGDMLSDLRARNATTIANLADIMSIQIGTNDISANVTATSWIAAYKEEINSYFDNGAKKVVAHFPPMKSDTTEYPWDATQKALYWEYLEMFEALANGYDGNLILDTYSRTLIDPDTDTADGTHLTQSAAYKLGRAQGQFILLAVESQRPYSNFMTNNLLTNPGLTGTGGSKGGICTGVVADGWTVGSNGSGVLDAVCSKTTDVFGDGREAQTVTLSGTSDASGKVLNLRQSLTLNDGVIGDMYECYCRFKIEGGHEGITAFYAQVSGQPFVSTENATTTGSFDTNDDNEISGCMATAVDGTLTANAPTIEVQFNVRLFTGTINAVVHSDSPILRKIE